MNSGTAAAMPSMEGAHDADALTPQQHNAIWDCLLAQPASQAVLEAMVEKAQAELQARMPGHGADGH
jgi:F0F1-type ATP synthase gamma subunit